MGSCKERLRVSVVCYARNEARYIRQMIESVLDQTYGDFEFLLFDNGSTDETRAIMQSFDDPRIRVEWSDFDISGPDHDFAALNNHAVNLTTGDLIAMIGGDDIACPDRLEMQMDAFMSDPLLDVCHSDAHHIDADSNLLPSCFSAAPYHDRNLLRIAFSYLQIAFPTVIFKRDSWAKAGFFRGEYAPDYDLWLRTAPYWRFRHLPYKLMYYRVHPDSASHSREGAVKTSEATVAIRAKFRKKYTIEEFFPEILDCEDTIKAKAAAHLELGNMMLGGGMANLQLALDEYRKADEYWPDHPAILHNVSLILALDGQAGKAEELLNRLPRDPIVTTNLMILKGLVRKPFVYSDARGICPQLFDAAKMLPRGTWKSDGTVA